MCYNPHLMKKYTLQNLIQEHSLNQVETHMTQEKLEKIITASKEYEVLEEDKGYILFKYFDKKLALLCDEEHNRMRVLCAITQYSSLAPKIKDSLMSANFSSTLDARYGVSEDTLFAAFMHPLSSLHEEEFLSGLKQVYNLSAGFGKTYSSAQIEFTKKK